jgi:mono/diheme cytochrome c family protein
MQKLIPIALLAGLINFTAFGAAPQSAPTLKNVPIQHTSPASGTQMYTTYCAVCHGPNGLGNGPAASALKVQPTDLTTLSQKNGGKFPSSHVGTVLQFGVNNPAHGSADMPVWGTLLGSLHGSSPDNANEVHQRIVNITTYLQQMQK